MNFVEIVGNSARVKPPTSCRSPTVARENNQVTKSRNLRVSTPARGDFTAPGRFHGPVKSGNFFTESPELRKSFGVWQELPRQNMSHVDQSSTIERIPTRRARARRQNALEKLMCSCVFEKREFIPRTLPRNVSRSSRKFARPFRVVDVDSVHCGTLRFIRRRIIQLIKFYYIFLRNPNVTTVQRRN